MCRFLEDFVFKKVSILVLFVWWMKIDSIQKIIDIDDSSDIIKENPEDNYRGPAIVKSIKPWKNQCRSVHPISLTFLSDDDEWHEFF